MQIGYVMEFPLSLISIQNILELPLLVMGPGLLLIFLFLVRFLRSLFSLRLVTAFTSLIYAFVIALILSQAGFAIVKVLGLEEKPAAQSSLQNFPDYRNQRLAQFDGIGSIEMHPVNR
jgi:hypothetical protein